MPGGSILLGEVVLTTGTNVLTGSYDFTAATVTGLSGDGSTPGLPAVLTVDPNGALIQGATGDGPSAGTLFNNAAGIFFNTSGFANRAALANNTDSAGPATFFTGQTDFSVPGAGYGTTGQVLTSAGDSAPPVWATASDTGTVTLIDLTAPSSLFGAPGGPITTSGTLRLALVNQVANTVFAGPVTGASTTPTFRALVLADLPLTPGTDYLTPTGNGGGLTSLTKAQVGLGNVENTALSTWAGSTSLTTLGTITTGTWHGTAIGDTYISSASTWNAKQSALTFSTGLTNTTGTVTVNASQSISTLSNLTGNGFVKTSSGTGTLSVDTTTYLTANQTITLSGDISGSGTTSITTTIGAAKVTNSMLAGSITAANLVGSDIATLGTVTTGIWHATLIGATYGGTGVNNGSSTITIGGNITFSGAFTFAGTVTANTAVTFPTSGTLANQTNLAPAVATLTDGSTITITCSAANAVQNDVVTLGGNRTLAISGATSGMTGVLIVKQDATGGRTLASPSGSIVVPGGGSTLSLTSTASAVDILCWLYDGTSYYWTVNSVLGATFSSSLIAGVTNGGDAASGIVGEIITSVLASGSAVSLTTATAKTVTSISLTAGDWDVTGMVDFHPGATTTGSYFQAGISTTTNALGSQDQYTSAPMALAAGLGVDVGLNCPVVRQSLSGTTTIYLTCVAGFALSTLTAYGTIRARRVR